MDRDKALKLLNGGEEGVRAWNDHRASGGGIPSLARTGLARANLIGVDLAGADLRGANLTDSELIDSDLTCAILRRANLQSAILDRADLNGADLEEASLESASLIEAYLSEAHLTQANLVLADLRRANLFESDLRRADLRRANLNGANLNGANLKGSIMNGAKLRKANLVETDFGGADLIGTDLRGAECGLTGFGNLDLSRVRGLDEIHHSNPSSIGMDTIMKSKGRISAEFLGNCGLTPWEVLTAKLYDLEMTPPRFADLQCHIFSAWTKGKDMINGCFISHSWKDMKFAEKLRDRLKAEEINVWLDKHDMVAGELQTQVWRAIQLHHVVILVLSEDSIKSDWVENELDMARQKEKAEGRAVLCPVSLDDAWKAKLDTSVGAGDPSRALWRTLQQKLVLDFSTWKTKAFEEEFGKLVRGLRVNYRPKDQPTK